jgi:excisionase family DNA binding protein
MTQHSSTATSHCPLVAGMGTTAPCATEEPPKPWDNPNPLFDVEQFAQYLNQKPDFIRQLIKEQRLPSIKIGRKVMLEKSAAEEIVRAGRRPATQPLNTDRFGYTR